VTVLVALAVGFIVLLMSVEMLLVVYTRVVVRSALDEAARAGSRADATTETCLSRAADVLDDLLGGRLGDHVTISCSQTSTEVIARADVEIEGMLPAAPVWGPFELTATAVKEPFAP